MFLEPDEVIESKGLGLACSRNELSSRESRQEYHFGK